MERITLAATERSPEVDFDFPGNCLRMAGESYPENAAAFFGPLVQALRKFLDDGAMGRVDVELRMTYFNSSSAKALMNMFQLLECAAAKGREVSIDWCFHRDDDTMEEFGEDFSQDFVHARFRLRPIETDPSTTDE